MEYVKTVYVPDYYCNVLHVEMKHAPLSRSSTLDKSELYVGQRWALQSCTDRLSKIAMAQTGILTLTNLPCPHVIVFLSATDTCVTLNQQTEQAELVSEELPQALYHTLTLKPLSESKQKKWIVACTEDGKTKSSEWELGQDLELERSHFKCDFRLLLILLILFS